jgi:predicted flap endonuclease-1-like 5' DNA nuclease
MNTMDVQGIGPANARKLAAAGIRTTEALLKKGASDKGRREIAAASGIGHAQVLRWVNHADLFRIKGIGPQYAEILEKAGVDTVAELSKRAAGTLYEKVLAANRPQRLVRKMPSRVQVEGWIAAARKLPRLISY